MAGDVLDGGGAGGRVHLHFDGDVGRGAEDVAFVGLVLERHGPGLGDEPFGQAGLGSDGGVHVDGAVGVGLGGEIDDA